MTQRVLLLIPEGLTFDVLSIEQQTAIRTVFGQYVTPMPGTVSNNGQQVCDALTGENFNPAVMPDYGIDWPIIGQWELDGSVLTPLDEKDFMRFLPEGSTLHEPHRWAGWPVLIGTN